MKKVMLFVAVLALAACAHKPSEREVFESGIDKGFRMGHAPQVLPIQIQPVSVSQVRSLSELTNPSAAVYVAPDREGLREAAEAFMKTQESGGSGEALPPLRDAEYPNW